MYINSNNDNATLETRHIVTSLLDSAVEILLDIKNTNRNNDNRNSDSTYRNTNQNMKATHTGHAGINAAHALLST